MPSPGQHAGIGEKKQVFGLVGAIGSGKSFVGESLREFGGHSIVADKLGHEALRQPEIKAELVARWGTGILDAGDGIDRRKVAAIVFADAREREALEAQVFPYIDQRIREEITHANADPAVRFIVLDAAIFLETGWGRVCDKVIFVAAPKGVRLARLLGRGWTAKEVEAREQVQFSLEEKQAHAHAIIDNSGDAEQTRRQLAELLAQWLPAVDNQQPLPVAR